MNTKVVILEDYVLSGGVLNQWAHDQRLRGAETKAQGKYLAIEGDLQLPIDQIVSITALDGIITGALVGFVILPTADLDNEIPEGYPQRLNAQNQVRTWRAWGHSLRQSVNGVLSAIAPIAFENDPNKGDPLTQAEIIAINAGLPGGYLFVDKDYAVEFFATPEWVSSEE